jgi:tRNA G18 (ribose-2'-O)-methylase SpoU
MSGVAAEWGSSWGSVVEADDPRLADYVRLRETSLRRHLESQHGLFIAEGEKVIRRAVDAGYRPRSFLLAERWLRGLADVLDRWPEVPVYVVTEALAERVTGFHVHRGALASLHREVRHTVGQLLAASDRLVVIEDVVDHTNVGAVLRNAAALGWDGALLAPRAADPLYRRAVKVSMGAVFSLPWARLTDWSAAPGLLRTAGFTTVALTVADDAVDLSEVAVRQQTPPGKIAILLGTEGAGLSQRWTDGADLRAMIPMQAGIDSLNVAAASAIACYVLGSTVGRLQSSGSSSASSSSRGETGQS